MRHQHFQRNKLEGEDILRIGDVVTVKENKLKTRKMVGDFDD